MRGMTVRLANGQVPSPQVRQVRAIERSPSDSKIVSSEGAAANGTGDGGPVAGWGSWSGGGLEGDSLAGEPLELADEVALAALGADA